MGKMYVGMWSRRGARDNRDDGMQTYEKATAMREIRREVENWATRGDEKTFVSGEYSMNALKNSTIGSVV